MLKAKKGVVFRKDDNAFLAAARPKSITGERRLLASRRSTLSNPANSATGAPMVIAAPGCIV
jgi:hypothetical protein